MGRGDQLARQIFTRTIDALNSAGLKQEAEQLCEVKNGDQWESYARGTFHAHQKYIEASKLRFMQYVSKGTIDWWEQYADAGAVLLGKATQAPVLKENELTKVQKSRFKELNKAVEKAAKSFIDAGMALYEIRSDKLYREK